MTKSVIIFGPIPIYNCNKILQYTENALHICCAFHQLRPEKSLSDILVTDGQINDEKNIPLL